MALLVRSVIIYVGWKLLLLYYIKFSKFGVVLLVYSPQMFLCHWQTGSLICETAAISVVLQLELQISEIGKYLQCYRSIREDALAGLCKNPAYLIIHSLGIKSNRNADKPEPEIVSYMPMPKYFSNQNQFEPKKIINFSV